MAAFAPEAFGPGFELLMSSGEPAFQGVAFDGDAFHIRGEAAAETEGHGARSVRTFRRLPAPVALPDDDELLLALI
jgi:hypothetical protein